MCISVIEASYMSAAQGIPWNSIVFSSWRVSTAELQVIQKWTWIWWSTRISFRFSYVHNHKSVWDSWAMAFGGGSNETMGVLWKVVGGQKTGGIMVRSGLSLTSTLEDSRLSVGSIVKELAMGNNRLRYELLRGEGPKSGWVSLRLRGIELMIRTKGDHGETEKLGVFRDLGMAPMDFMRSICPNKTPMSHFLNFLVGFLSYRLITFLSSFTFSKQRPSSPAT